MKTLLKCMVLLAICCTSGCLMLPFPHRRVHAYGVKGQVIDSSSLRAITNATVTADGHGGPVAKTDATGAFKVHPEYGWHGGVLIGVLNYSILPTWDMTWPGRRVIVTAPGFMKKSFEVSTLPEDMGARFTNQYHDVQVHADMEGNYLRSMSMKLQPLKHEGNLPTTP